MDIKDRRESAAAVLPLRGWKLDWHGEDTHNTTDLYLVDGAWQPLGESEEARTFVLPGGFDARLDGLGSKSVVDGFGRSALLTSELVRGELTPVVIDSDGRRFELLAA